MCANKTELKFGNRHFFRPPTPPLQDASRLQLADLLVAIAKHEPRDIPDDIAAKKIVTLLDKRCPRVRHKWTRRELQCQHDAECGPIVGFPSTVLLYLAKHADVRTFLKAVHYLFLHVLPRSVSFQGDWAG